jgi:hypothetical protein
MANHHTMAKIENKHHKIILGVGWGNVIIEIG